MQYSFLNVENEDFGDNISCIELWNIYKAVNSLSLTKADKNLERVKSSRKFIIKSISKVFLVHSLILSQVCSFSLKKLSKVHSQKSRWISSSLFGNKTFPLLSSPNLKKLLYNYSAMLSVFFLLINSLVYANIKIFKQTMWVSIIQRYCKANSFNRSFHQAFLFLSNG